MQENVVREVALLLWQSSFVFFVLDVPSWYDRRHQMSPVITLSTWDRRLEKTGSLSFACVLLPFSMTGESENSPIKKKDRSHIPPPCKRNTIRQLSPFFSFTKRYCNCEQYHKKSTRKCNSGRIEFRNHNLNAETSLAPVPPLGVVSRDLKSFHQYLPCRLGKITKLTKAESLNDADRSWM